MTTKDITILVLAGAFVMNATFTFRFQRTTLSICRALYGQNDPRVQTVMTPVWLGLLGWTHTALIFVMTGVLWYFYGWLFGVAAFLYGFAGLALLDLISPLPTYRFCFKLIEAELDRHTKTDTSGEFARLKEQVAATRKEYGI